MARVMVPAGARKVVGQREWFGNYWDPRLQMWREHLRQQVGWLWEVDGQTFGQWDWEYVL